MKKIIILLFLFAFTSALHAQMPDVVSGEINKSIEIGTRAYNEGDIRTALNNFIMALNQAQENGIDMVAADMFSKIGVCYQRLGNMQLALQNTRQALRMAEELSDLSLESQVMGNLAYVFMTTKKYDSSLFYFNRILEIDRTKKDQLSEANHLSHIGGIYQRMKDYDKSLENFQAAVGIYRLLDSTNSEAYTMEAIGITYRLMGDLDESKISHDAARMLFDKCGNKAEEARQWSEIGLINASMEDEAESDKAFASSIKTVAETGDTVLIADEVGYIARQLTNMHRYNQALKYYRELLKLHQRNNDRRDEAIILNMIGLCQHRLGQEDEAIASLEASIAITKEIGDNLGMINSMTNIGLVYKEQGDIDKALKQFNDILDILKTNNITKGREQIENQIKELQDLKQSNPVDEP